MMLIVMADATGPHPSLSPFPKPAPPVLLTSTSLGESPPIAPSFPAQSLPCPFSSLISASSWLPSPHAPPYPWPSPQPLCRATSGKRFLIMQGNLGKGPPSGYSWTMPCWNPGFPSRNVYCVWVSQRGAWEEAQKSSHPCEFIPI